MVFFGPDTYRFARFLEEETAGRAGVRHLVDIGTGSGAGAVVVARAFPQAAITISDINPNALAFAAVNLQVAGISADLRLGDAVETLPLSPDLIIANPPFIAGSGGRTYRQGGGTYGSELSLKWAVQGAAALAPSGRFLLYTGVAIVEGVDQFKAALLADLDLNDFCLGYREIDPDIFGEEMSNHAYKGAERIAAVGAVITRRP